MQKIADRKMENFRASQATFFSEIKAAVKHNQDVLAEVMAVPRCDDRGSKAIVAIRRHIMQGQDIGSAEKDSEMYFNKCAESFNLKYPVGATDPIAVKKELVNAHLTKALFELEQHVNDFRKKFHKFPEKHWVKYIPEQNLIGIIRDLLPETPEWRQVRIMIIQGQENGDDFDKALGLVRFMISEFTSKQEKIAMHARGGSSRGTQRVTSSVHVPGGGKKKSDAEKKADNDKYGLDPAAHCYSCGQTGHKSNWWGCPQHEKNSKNGKNGGRGGRGKKQKDEKKGGDKKQKDEKKEEKEPKDYSGYRCNKCLEFGHIAKDCPGPSQSFASPAVQSNADGSGAGYYVQHSNAPYSQFHQAPTYNYNPPVVQPANPHLPQPHLPKGWFRANEGTQMMPAGAHVQQSPMQHLQRNVRAAHPPPAPRTGNAPPAGSWNRQYRNYQHPNEI